MNKFRETIKKHNLVSKGDKILVGVSGGPDSLTLLLELFRLKPELKLSLHIAHIDHGLRESSGSDALFVKNWAKKLDLPLSIKRLNPKLTKIKGSLEELWRQSRQDFLIKTAQSIKADKVALGHNLDDQAETVLMRLLRGTGLSGLSGISLKRKIGGVTFIRPLLETKRDEINKFLKRNKIKPCIDLSNKNEIFFRNRIRHKLIPLLESEYNPNIMEVLANLAESTSYDYEYLDLAAKKSLRGNSLKFKIDKLMKLHPAILRLRIRQAIGRIQGDTRRISFVHIKEIEDLIFNRPIGSIVDLPKGISLQKTRSCLRFFKR
ncbi:MAG: tRNA lysidine(34) synthetase TilS [Candidatus Omnitrophica bacterium CG11_big_fil_rev_8_21_14_0_20_41_12]|nr:MAG: tRNA lysidine(34) synthetase TilS [Candidatus Omnitrophica bacterium CG11_big_fil_rev_8_21_14_0_20_41_12]